MILLNQNAKAIAMQLMGYKMGIAEEYTKQIRILLYIWANFSPASI